MNIIHQVLTALLLTAVTPALYSNILDIKTKTYTHSIHDAAGKGLIYEVKFWLTHPYMSINHQNIDNDTPLLWAANNNQHHVVWWLLTNGADPNIANRFGITPLHIAAEKGFTSIIIMLCQAGANLLAQTHWKDMPIHLALHNAHLESILALTHFHEKNEPKKWKLLLSHTPKLSQCIFFMLKNTKNQTLIDLFQKPDNYTKIDRDFMKKYAKKLSRNFTVASPTFAEQIAAEREKNRKQKELDNNVMSCTIL